MLKTSGLLIDACVGRNVSLTTTFTEADAKRDPWGTSRVVFDGPDRIRVNPRLWYVSCSTHNPLRRWSCTKWPCRRLFGEQWSSCLLTSALSGFLLLLRVRLWHLTAQNKSCIISFSELPSATSSTKGPLPILTFLVCSLPRCTYEYPPKIC